VSEPSIYSKPILKTKRKHYKETTLEKIKIKEEENTLIEGKESIQKTHPALEIVKEYFSSQEASEFEAERFFNYYTSNGWLIGGKTKMKDWQAAARNWILNTAKFSSSLPPKTTGSNKPKAQNLHTSQNKDYDEPL
jgi:ribosomal protein L35AE/L33A